MRPERERLIRSLFEEYIEMYASRDDRLTARFSENFSGYTGGGDFLVEAAKVLVLFGLGGGEGAGQCAGDGDLAGVGFGLED